VSWGLARLLLRPTDHWWCSSARVTSKSDCPFWGQSEDPWVTTAWELDPEIKNRHMLEIKNEGRRVTQRLLSLWTWPESEKGEKEKSQSHSVYFPKIPRAHSCCWALEWLFYALLRSFKGVWLFGAFCPYEPFPNTISSIRFWVLIPGSNSTIREPGVSWALSLPQGRKYLV
jgi:hypothetical protein